jgi:tripartite-type tricarboxylate transporter receptor subunit TctC
LFKLMTGTDITNIPYKGGAPATIDLLGGQVDMMFEQMYSASANLRAGKLKGLAITSKTRSPLFPDLPTLHELGLKDFEVNNWQGFVAPTGTPAAIITRLNEVCNQALQDPMIRAQLLEQGNVPGGGSPEQFAAHIKAESAKWSKLVKSAQINSD